MYRTMRMGAEKGVKSERTASSGDDLLGNLLVDPAYAEQEGGDEEEQKKVNDEGEDEDASEDGAVDGDDDDAGDRALDVALRQAAMKRARSELPYILELPDSHEDFLSLLSVTQTPLAHSGAHI